MKYAVILILFSGCSKLYDIQKKEYSIGTMCICSSGNISSVSENRPKALINAAREWEQIDMLIKEIKNSKRK